MYKIIFTYFTFIISFSFLSIIDVNAQSGSFTRPIIGVLNMQGIERDSLAAKGVRLERDKFLAKYQAQVKELETEMREEDQRLVQQRNVLAPEVFKQQVEAFQQKMGTVQQDLRLKQQALNTVYQQAMVEINQEMMRITQTIAQERDLNMVLPQNIVLLSDPSMDITRPVLEILNERLPSVKMKDPEVATEDTKK